ncbi:MAG: hypothetical protein RLZZ598_1770 [Pseudomonadota bacterium]|jgi:monofunctional glycosyltransferase
MKRLAGLLWRYVLLVLLCAVALQLMFLLRITLMRWIDPPSTTFQRSEIWRLASTRGELRWSQAWTPYARLPASLKRAVIASEDAGFTDHGGVDWDAIEKAWERNERAQARVDQLNAARERRTGARQPTTAVSRPATPKIVGGSTITQQLAKNLFLSGERSLLRKGQEFVLSLMLEALLDKQRILELYLNHVEWGEGVFGAQAAARHYFHTDVEHLAPMQSARLAVMLPAPKRFEKLPGSPYVAGRAATILARMSAVELP